MTATLTAVAAGEPAGRYSALSAVARALRAALTLSTLTRKGE